MEDEMIRFIAVLAAFASILVVLGKYAVDEGISKTFSNAAPDVRITNQPPSVYVQGQIRICAQVWDADGDFLRVRWSAKRQRGFDRPNGSRFSNYVTRGIERCAKYTAPASQGWDTVRVSAVDARGARGRSTVMFCVLPDDFNGSAQEPIQWACPRR